MRAPSLPDRATFDCRITQRLLGEIVQLVAEYESSGVESYRLLPRKTDESNDTAGVSTPAAKAMDLSHPALSRRTYVTKFMPLVAATVN
jgi:hypothetical protein